MDREQIYKEYKDMRDDCYPTHECRAILSDKYGIDEDTIRKIAVAGSVRDSKQRSSAEWELDFAEEWNKITAFLLGKEVVHG